MLDIKYFYTASVGIAAVASLVSFRFKYPWHLRLFSILLLITFAVELTATLNIAFHLKLNNNSIYSVFVPFEYVIYCLYYRTILKNSTAKKIINGFIIVFPIFAIATTTFVFGWKNWNSYMMIAACLAAVSLGIRYYYEIFTSPELTKLNNTPEFWIATGMILLYSCQLPFFGALHYLVTNYPDLAMDLFYVMQLVNTMMYLLFTYGYLCKINTVKS